MTDKIVHPFTGAHFDKCKCRYCVLLRRIDELERENQGLRARLDTLARGLQGNGHA
jgi:hypothetical protein